MIRNHCINGAVLQPRQAGLAVCPGAEGRIDLRGAVPQLYALIRQRQMLGGHFGSDLHAPLLGPAHNVH